MRYQHQHQHQAYYAAAAAAYPGYAWVSVPGTLMGLFVVKLSPLGPTTAAAIKKERRPKKSSLSQLTISIKRKEKEEEGGLSLLRGLQFWNGKETPTIS